MNGESPNENPVLDLIQSDLKRESQPKWRMAALAIAPAILAAAAGLGARGDFIEAFLPSNLIPAIASSTAGIVGFFWIFFSPRLRSTQKVARYAPLILAALLFSVLQPQDSISLAKFAGENRYWPEALHCLTLGIGIGFAGTVMMCWLCSLFFPTMNRTTSIAFSIATGWLAAVALAFHCMGPLTSHIIVSHWGAAAVTALTARGAQSWLFRRRMASVLGRASRSIARLGKLR